MGGAAACFDEGAAVVSLGDDGGAVGAGAAAAQYDSADVEVELAGDEEAAGAQQDGSAKAVCVEGKNGHVVDGGLQEEGVIPAGGSDGDHSGDRRYWLASLIAGEGEVDGRVLGSAANPLIEANSSGVLKAATRSFFHLGLAG